MTGHIRGVAALIPAPRTEIGPGAVHVPGWLDVDHQRSLVAACREWARMPAGMRATALPSGGVMSVRTVCLGWHWTPYRYSRVADGGTPVTPFPGWLAELGAEAVTEAYGSAERYRPDIRVPASRTSDWRRVGSTSRCARREWTE